MAVGRPTEFLVASDFPVGTSVPLPGGGQLFGTGPRTALPATVPGVPQIQNGFGIPTPIGPITISLPGGCGPLEVCSGPTIAGVCLGRCVTQGFNGFGFQDVPGGPRPGPTPTPVVQQANGGCPPLGVSGQATILCASGCHPNKADYFRKGGAFIAKGTICVRNRRRNPLNPRALDRAISRIGSAQNAVAKLGFKKKAPQRAKRRQASVC